MIHPKIAHKIPLNTLETRIFVSVNKKVPSKKILEKYFFSRKTKPRAQK